MYIRFVMMEIQVDMEVKVILIIQMGEVDIVAAAVIHLFTHITHPMFSMILIKWPDMKVKIIKPLCKD